MILWKNVNDVSFVLVYLSFICSFLFKILIEGINFVINSVSTRFCFISVMLNICLKYLFHSLFCTIVRVGTRKNWIFPKYVNLILPCAVANLLEVFNGIILDVEFLLHSKWGYIWYLILLLNLLKNQFQCLVTECFLDFLIKVEDSEFFLYVVLLYLLYFDIRIWTSFEFLFSIVCYIMRVVLFVRKMKIFVIVIIIRFNWYFVFFFNVKHVYWKCILCFAFVIRMVWLSLFSCLYLIYLSSVFRCTASIVISWSFVIVVIVWSVVGIVSWSIVWILSFSFIWVIPVSIIWRISGLIV